MEPASDPPGPPEVEPIPSIRRLGFRRWYERELIRGHAALVTCLLCGLTVAALLEQVRFNDPGWRPISMLMIVLAATLVGGYSWRSYSTVLRRAEHYGAASLCPGCRAYGRFNIVSSGMDTYPSPAAEELAPLPVAWMRVACRKCGTNWRMPE